ncbi:MAG TPA: hypothetical protein VIJ78_01795 [Pseudolabrys sp.]
MAGGSHGLAQSASVIVAIATMDEGAPPTDFDFARTGQGKTGQWRVVADPTATAGRAIEQSDADRTDYRFPLAILRSFSAKNVQASVRFKAVAGTVDQAGGLAVRVLDSDNYYVVRANAMEDNVRFYRVVKGKRQELAGANLRVAGNQWHTLGLNAEGDTFTILFNGKALFSTTDRTFAEAGKVALWTKADSITRFDQLALKALP